MRLSHAHLTILVVICLLVDFVIVGIFCYSKLVSKFNIRLNELSFHCAYSLNICNHKLHHSSLIS